MIKEITQFIADQAGLNRDTDIFAGHRLKESIAACDVILETAGGSVFFCLSDRADPVIQVLSRDETYFTARARAWKIYNAIFGNIPLGSAGWTLPVITVGEEYEAMVIEPLAIPQYIGQDEKLRFEFSTNYIFRIRKI